MCPYRCKMSQSGQPYFFLLPPATPYISHFEFSHITLFYATASETIFSEELERRTADYAWKSCAPSTSATVLFSAQLWQPIFSVELYFRMSTLEQIFGPAYSELLPLFLRVSQFSFQQWHLPQSPCSSCWAGAGHWPSPGLLEHTTHIYTPQKLTQIQKPRYRLQQSQLRDFSLLGNGKLTKIPKKLLEAVRGDFCYDTLWEQSPTGS